MKASKTSKLLAGVLALFGAAYLPQANAAKTVSLGDITAPADPNDWGSNSVGAIPAKGSFDYIYTFSISNKFSSYDLTASVLTSKIEKGSDAKPTQADSFSYFALENSSGQVLELGTVGKDASGHYAASLPADFWLKAGSYKLELKGISSGSNATYGGSISISPVPEAEEWAMLLLGLPMLSWAVRRKQA